MNSNYEIEKLTDWHYNKHLKSDNDLVLNQKIIIDLNTLFTVDNIIKSPYDAYGGVKRIHIGDTALNVDSKDINQRCLNMIKAGYNYENYFIEFNNDIFDDLADKMKKQFKLSYEHHCAIIIKPGQCMPAHGDTYSYLIKLMKIKYPEVQYDLKQNTRRYLTFLTEWEWGQCIGAGNEIKWQWNIGDVYTWKHKLLHWCSNASFTPIVFLEITGLEL